MTNETDTDTEPISPELQEAMDLAEKQVEELLEGVTPEDGEIEVDSRTISLDLAFPLTLGDWRELEKKKLLDSRANVKNLGADGIAKLLHHLFGKVDDKVKPADLDKLSLKKVTRLFLFVRKKMEEEEPDLGPPKSSS